MLRCMMYTVWISANPGWNGPGFSPTEIKMKCQRVGLRVSAALAP